MQRGQDFSLRVLLRANFEFLFFKFSALPLSLLTLPLCFSFFLFSPPFSPWFCLLPCWLLLVVVSWEVGTPGGCALRGKVYSNLPLRPLRDSFSGFRCSPCWNEQ